MGSCTDIIKCPKCGFYNEQKNQGCIVQVYTDGEEFVACENPDCDYGYIVIWVPKCVRCGINILDLLPSTEDIWIIEGVNSCPICGSPFIRWELELYDEKATFVGVPKSQLRPMSELIDELKREDQEADKT